MPPLKALGLALCVPLLATSALGQPAFELTGFARTRYYHFEGIPVDRAPGSSRIELFDYRVTLDPELQLGPVTLKGRVDVLDDVILGNNDASATILSGLSRGTSNFEFTSDTDFRNRLEEIDDFQIERLWAEIPTPVGLLSVGRQPSSFGLGILANAGQSLELGAEGNGPNGGDSVDRIRFSTDLERPLNLDGSHWLVAVAYDRAVEGQVGAADDDVHQLILATLFTDGGLSPRVIGDHELGAYLVWASGDRWDTDVLLADAYFHLRAGRWFVQGEGVIGFGQTRRGGLIPGESKETAEEDLVESLGEDFAESLGGSLSEEDAFAFARTGFPAYLQTFVATELLDAGFSESVSLAIAERGVAAGLPAIYDETIDVFLYGGVLRGGLELDHTTLTLEVGHASPPSDEDFIAVRVGPEGSGDPDRETAIIDAVDDVVGSNAFTGRDFEAYPFDSEYDAALVLYELAGPINPASGQPGIVNTTYVKLTAEWRPRADLRTHVSVLGGWLNRSITLSQRPGEVVAFEVEDEDDPNERVRRERDLGVEIGAGVTWEAGEHLVAELRAAYLISGDAFGPAARDIWGIRPQVALRF